MSNWRGWTCLRSPDVLGECKGMVGGSGEGRRDNGDAQRQEWAVGSVVLINVICSQVF